MLLNKETLSEELIEEHINLALKCAGNKPTEINYKIRYSSNEPLRDLFSRFSMEGKRAIVVLSSGDHYFYAKNYGAMRVDAIDINPLTYYYAGFRKCWMNHFGTFYPGRIFIFDKYVFKAALDLFLGGLDIRDKERDAIYQFWCGYLERVDDKQHQNLFYDGDYSNELCFDTTPPKSLYSFDEPLNFYQQDLTKKFRCDKEYDIAVLSNLIEQYCMDKDKLIVIRDNLNALLSDDGKAICSCCCRKDMTELEKQIFGECFDSELYYGSNDRLIGYQLSKRC